MPGGTVCGGHEERPTGEIAEANPHPTAASMTLPYQAAHSEPVQNPSDRYLEVAEWDYGPVDNRKQDLRSYREAVPQRDGQERTADSGAVQRLGCSCGVSMS